MKRVSLPKRFSWLGAALLLMLGAAALWGVKATHAMSFAQAELQERIDRQLGRDIAIKGPAQALLRSIRMKKAALTLHDGKAAIAFELGGELRTGRNFEMAGTAVGAPAYAGGALYFHPEQIDVRRLSYEGQSVADLVARVARSHVATEKARDFLEDKARKADVWAVTAAEAALRRFLEEQPIYRLKADSKGAFLKAALEKITVEDGRLLVTFSFWRFTVTTIAGVFSLLAGVISSILIARMLLIGEDIESSVS